MSITIRPAVVADCPRLLELIRELAAYERAPQEVTVTLDHFIETGFGSRPVWWAFVAFTKDSSGAAGQVHGFALYYIRYSTWKGSEMYLEDIIVTEAMRGKGIGRLLFDRLIEEAREKKFGWIIWQVLNWNEDAMRFYEKYQARFDSEWVNCSMAVN